MSAPTKPNCSHCGGTGTLPDTPQLHCHWCKGVGKELGWYGVDLDGTLSLHDRWRGEDHIGDPIPAMLDRVKQWLADGQEVRIVTARVGVSGRKNPDGALDDEAFAARQVELIEAWCFKHIGLRLRITASKDMNMIVLFDDRAIAVERNTGKLLSALPEERRDKTPREVESFIRSLRALRFHFKEKLDTQPPVGSRNTYGDGIKRGYEESLEALADFFPDIFTDESRENVRQTANK